MLRYVYLLFLSIALNTLTACHAEPDKESILNTSIQLTLNRSGEDFSKDYSDQMGIDIQPAGMNFYTLRFSPSNLGTAHVNADKNSFSIHNVFSIMGSEVPDAKQGVTNYLIKAGLSAPEFIDHNQARLNMAAILQDLRNKGWQYYIGRSDPRLQGKETVTYLLANPYSLYSLDSAYVPTIEEWMQIDNGTAWQFYANHRYLSVMFHRDTDKLGINQPGVYMLTFEIRTEEDQFSSHFGEENSAPARWRALRKEQKIDEQLAQERAKREADLVRQGYHIDTSYRDPEFLPITEQ